MTRSALGPVLLILAASIQPRSSDALDLQIDGIVITRAAMTASQPSWIDRGFGKLADGASAPDDTRTLFRGQAQLGLDWKAGDDFRLHLHGVARSEGGGQQAGLVEGFALYRPKVSEGTRLLVKVGTFFPQTSRENTDRLWSSPYTLTLSALNTWIAEELRLTGIEVGVTHKTARDDSFLLAGTAFGANDTAGTLIAWRGWSLGDRLTSVGELLPLPPLRSFRPGGGFADQRSDGTRPIDELDQRLGWQARVRWDRPDTAALQASYYDNRGDRLLRRGQYAWRTRFGSVGGEAHLGSRLVLVAEAAAGSAGMGDVARPHVDIDFAVGYVLASWGGEKARLSVRYDRFENVDRDHTAEPDQEKGQAATIAVLWRPTTHLRLGVEGLKLWNQRPAAADAGVSSNVDAARVLTEVRILF